ncbi:hypothetical protein BO70DRAFT_77593 [Aspergillus heteromorphus CBS 117.55]|uniref:Ankyrin n=1 Tax=Aspergillus heteromorphus CBS 117.55 TaxID=1448321 RepID=A0A317WZL5_9EURO|nr:uncharacterized protein BO70DRAFT_77593 [Aspergillus heteromorphus CBS 117.55]PWY90762.1 hypothetical protein BO70DRAFT_77593 [Aspergillus heteromorphus CBS 117.55]
MYQADKQGDIPLVRVIKSPLASQDRYESARILLLQSDIDWKSHSWDGKQNPLRAAVQLGDSNMCRLLVGIGNMNPLSALADGSEGQVELRDRTPDNEDNELQIWQFLCSLADMGSVNAQH